MRDLDWIGMSDTQRGQLIAMWLLAADRKGTVPDDPTLIARLCFMSDVPDLEWFVQQGFMERDVNVTPTRQPVDANVTSDRRQHDAPETEAEETRIEAEERTRARGLATTNGTGPPGLVGVIHRTFITKGKHLMLSEHQMEFVRSLADRAGHEPDPAAWAKRYLAEAWKLRQGGQDVWARATVAAVRDLWREDASESHRSHERTTDQLQAAATPRRADARGTGRIGRRGHGHAPPAAGAGMKRLTQMERCDLLHQRRRIQERARRLAGPRCGAPIPSRKGTCCLRPLANGRCGHHQGATDGVA